MWGFLQGEPVILASSSPRRRKLLQDTGLDFEVKPVAVDEVLSRGVRVEEAVMELSGRKAEKAAVGLDKGWIIGADTVVVLGAEILGKPEGLVEAEAMIRRLSGRRHRVITGFTILHLPGMESVSDFSSTDVIFYPLSDNTIRDYLSTGEYIDKAGGYGAQGYGGFLIEEFRGCFFNVVGLPLAKLRRAWMDFRSRIDNINTK